MTEERPPEPTPASSPSYTPPPVPPPQPAAAWAPPPSAAPAGGQRSALSLGAGILLVILGAFGALTSLALLTIGREFIRQFDFSTLPGLERVSDPNGLVASGLVFFGIVLLACSTFYIVGGVGVMRSRSWGRVIGIVIGVLAGLFWLLGLVGGEGRRSDGLGFVLVLLVIHVYVLVALLFFWRSKATA